MGDHEYFQFLAFRWDVTRAQQLARHMPVHRFNPEPWFDWLGAIQLHEEYVGQADVTRPLIAVRIREAQGAPLIIDGWHRLARARRDHIAELPVVVLDVDQEFEVRVFGGTKQPPSQARPAGAEACRGSGRASTADDEFARDREAPS